jgi:hypothetical protein
MKHTHHHTHASVGHPLALFGLDHAHVTNKITLSAPPSLQPQSSTNSTTPMHPSTPFGTVGAQPCPQDHHDHSFNPAPSFTHTTPTTIKHTYHHTHASVEHPLALLGLDHASITTKIALSGPPSKHTHTTQPQVSIHTTTTMHPLNPLRHFWGSAMPSRPPQDHSFSPPPPLQSQPSIHITTPMHP